MQYQLKVFRGKNVPVGYSLARASSYSCLFFPVLFLGQLVVVLINVHKLIRGNTSVTIYAIIVVHWMIISEEGFYFFFG